MPNSFLNFYNNRYSGDILIGNRNPRKDPVIRIIYSKLFKIIHDLIFNTKIKDRQYNYNLSEDTRVAVVQSGKLPKFFLKSSWTPMSVIAFDTKMGLRHGKTSVYANCCDLIIEWAEKEVMFDNRLGIK